MASVRLNFVKPENEDLTKLHIYESSSKDGTYTLIETVTDIGEFPNYISFYTTDEASSLNGWFVIEWEDSKGAKTPRSNPVQANTKTVPGEISNRVLLRDPSISEGLAVEEAEITVSDFFMTDAPYDVDPADVTYKEWGGLTFLTMARIYLTELIVGTGVEGYTAGIVAQQAGSSARSMDNIKKLIDAGNELLNRNYTIVAQLEDYDPVAGISGQTIDQSRLLVEIL